MSHSDHFQNAQCSTYYTVDEASLKQDLAEGKQVLVSLSMAQEGADDLLTLCKNLQRGGRHLQYIE